ncbi:glycoside hydrolase family 5 protein [Gautieria morchelliformis]|nr:glycoside hydrolase family 5 protein [Gautieria morchelliformis]
MATMGGQRDLADDVMQEKRAMYSAPARSRRRSWLIAGAIALLLLIVAAVVGIYFGLVKPHKNNSTNSASSSSAANSSSPGSGSSSGTSKNLVVTGGDGSKVTTQDGSTFTYSNPYGGYWWSDPNSPFANNAQAQSWTPPLNQSFKWGQDKIYGVNLGGWLNTEPFIAPALYQKYSSNPTPPVDEWTLSQAMAADTAGGGLSQLEQHYKTFITEQDFAEIAGAGLNFVRIPLPFWAIEVRSGEPYLGNVAWKYFLMAIEWARKYGIRINLDFHALPGSQNGWNHSGRLGTINVLNGVMGLANAERSLSYIRILAEFISQPQYRDVVPMFGITNEPQASVMGMDVLQAYYFQAYNIVREASGVGEGNGPMVSFHDGFESLTNWVGFLTNADRVSMDTHPYFAFGGQSSAAISSYAPQACSTWGPMINNSMGAFGMTTAGEFSLGTNDCGLFVNGVGLGTRYEGTFAGGPTTATGSCAQWDNWQAYSADTKNQLKQFAMSSMDALQNWFFWNWKIGNSTAGTSDPLAGTVQAPFWSYQLGLQQGWIPTDPRSAAGACKNSNPWTGPLAAWQTGGSGAGSLAPSATSSLVWPPAAISNAGPASLLPTYTPTGTIPTLAVPTFTASSPATTFSAGNGWANAQDTGGAFVPISGCSYPDPWSGVGAPVPTAPCSGSGGGAAAASAVTTAAATKREAAPPLVTLMRRL